VACFVTALHTGLFAAFGRKLGFVTPRLWLNHLAFNDITEGDNGFYRARIGPDACTGLGSPIGSKIAALFDAAAAVAVTSAMPTVPEGWSGMVSMLYQDGTPVGEPMLESSEPSAKVSPFRP